MSYDFGYTWYWTHGHLVPLGIFAAVAALAFLRGWSRWLAGIAAAGAVWGLAGFLITQYVLDANRPLTLPTEAFLRGGSGDVVDVGAGSGRSSLMVLLARPSARVTALDIYSGYFGIDRNTPERVRANARAAGAAARLEVVTGDMRAMPLEDGRYDAAVSAFAIDHVNLEGRQKALAEVARVLKPGGEFLLMIVNVDGWLRVAYPVPHGHGGYFSRRQDAARWRAALEEAGLEVVESGTRPATLYFLARRRP